MTLRLLQSELIKDGSIDYEFLDQVCVTFEGALTQAKASRRRPTSPEQQLFTEQELEWFSKNSYNMALKYCAEIPPQNLVRLLVVCAEVGAVTITCVAVAKDLYSSLDFSGVKSSQKGLLI